MDFTVDARGKIIIALTSLFLLAVTGWSMREYKHAQSSAALLAQVQTLQTEKTAAFNTAMASGIKNLELTRQLEISKRQLVSSKDASKSYTMEVRPDGSKLVRIDSQISTRLQQTEDRMKELTTQLENQKTNIAMLEQHIDERTTQVDQLTSELRTVQTNQAKQVRHVGAVVGAGLDSPVENIRVGGAGFFGPLFAVATVKPGIIWDHGQQLEPQALVGMTW